MTLLGRLTTLTHLDEAVITDEEAAEATVLATGAKIQQVTVTLLLCELDYIISYSDSSGHVNVLFTGDYFDSLPHQR